MRRKKPGYIDVILNVSLVVVLVYAICRPGSPVRARYDAWRAQVRFAGLATEHWTELSATSAMLGASQSDKTLIVEFGDYQCPACRQSHPQLDAALNRYPALAIGFRHYPLARIHSRAEGAARAAICAEFQGRFQKMHALLMETSEWEEDGDWSRLAEMAEVPKLSAFRECLTGDAVAARLRQDRELADALGVNGTPMFFYASGAHAGYIDEEDLIRILDHS